MYVVARIHDCYIRSARSNKYVSNITTASSRRKQFKTVYVSCTEMLIRRLFVVQKVITSVSGTQTIGRFITLSLYPAAILYNHTNHLYITGIIIANHVAGCNAHTFVS